MKQCPICRSTFTDATLRFCLSDGATLTDLSRGLPNARQTEETVVMPSHGAQIGDTAARETAPQRNDRPAKSATSLLLKIGVVVVILGIIVVLAAAAGMFIYYRAYR